MRSHRTLAAAVVLLAFTGVPAVEEDDPEKIFTCTDADGNVAFQQEPCELTKPKSKRAEAPAPKAAAKAKAPAPAKARPATYVLGKKSAASKPAPPLPPPLKNVPWEPTWKAFVEAMRQGDGATAAQCLTARALTDLGPKLQSAKPEVLKAMVGGYERVVVEGDVGPYWSIRVHRAGARPKWVFFERTVRGEWKIAAI